MIELSRAKHFLRERTYKAIECGRADRADAADISKIRVIPVNTVSGSEMMYALRLSDIEIDFGDGYRAVDALAVFSSHAINAEGASALVPSSLNFGSKKNNLHIKEFL
jgi:hypothetical protein